MTETMTTPTKADIQEQLFRLRDAGFLWSRSINALLPYEYYNEALSGVPLDGLRRAVDKLISGETVSLSGQIPKPKILAEMARSEARAVAAP